MAGLVVADKRQRVANYHHETVKSAAELLTASGLDHIEQLNRSHIYRRISALEVARLDPDLPLSGHRLPAQGRAPRALQERFRAGHRHQLRRVLPPADPGVAPCGSSRSRSTRFPSPTATGSPSAEPLLRPHPPHRLRRPHRHRAGRPGRGRGQRAARHHRPIYWLQPLRVDRRRDFVGFGHGDV